MQLCLNNDFGKPFVIAGTAGYLPAKMWEKIKEGQRQSLAKLRRDLDVFLYTGGRFGSVLCLSLEVPCFDSGDRQYDSWHNLYLYRRDDGIVSGIYAIGGYELAKLQYFEKLMDCPDEIKELLEDI